MCRWVKSDSKVRGFTRTKSKKAAAATDEKENDANAVEGYSCLSVWRVRVRSGSSRDGGDGNYAILGHGLLKPYRCIMVRLVSIAVVGGRAGTHLKISFTMSPCRRYEHIFFATAFEWIRDCCLETDTGDVELLRCSFEITGWQTLVVTGIEDAKLVWTKSGVGA